MLARATRYDAASGPWDNQMAFVYVPDDRNMVTIIQAMESEQVNAVRGAARDELGIQAIGEATPRNNITPVGSQAEQRRWSQVGNLFAWAGEEWAMEDAKPAASAQLTLPTVAPQHLPDQTPSQMEANLRRKIDDYCKDLDRYQFGGKWGETNKCITRQFSMPRGQMSLVQLTKVVSLARRNLQRWPPRRAAQSHAQTQRRSPQTSFSFCHTQQNRVTNYKPPIKFQMASPEPGKPS